MGESPERTHPYLHFSVGGWSWQESFIQEYPVVVFHCHYWARFRWSLATFQLSFSLFYFCFSTMLQFTFHSAFIIANNNWIGGLLIVEEIIDQWVYSLAFHRFLLMIFGHSCFFSSCSNCLALGIWHNILTYIGSLLYFVICLL